jgi:hypothetical protein
VTGGLGGGGGYTDAVPQLEQPVYYVWHRNLYRQKVTHQRVLLECFCRLRSTIPNTPKKKKKKKEKKVTHQYIEEVSGSQ